MRKMRLWIVLILALTSGGLAALLALRYLRQQSSPLGRREAQAGKIVLAARPLAVGMTVQDADVKLIDWPGGVMPVGFISSVKEAVGRGVITPIAENEPLLLAKLSTRDAGAGLQLAIHDGMRALSVKVDEVVGVAGFVLPGTRVDVLITLNPNTTVNRPESIARTILQNIQVLASGQVTQPDQDGKPIKVSVVTLLVSPDQAELLSLAAQEGKIQMSLRNTLDTTAIKTPGASVRELSGIAPAAAAAAVPRQVVRARVAAQAPARDPAVIVEGYKGGERTLTTFKQP
jgi:pilus assembly protein CpaB